uniref:Carboxylesterase type B domain-containing protein n=1 Tax=Schistocephalus solidus TaxID=70667 RepID=A0A0X3PZ08_SCHSO
MGHSLSVTLGLVLVATGLATPTPLPQLKHDDCPPNSPYTRTPVGTFCGQRETVIWPGSRQTQVDIYYGIRYAQPPVGFLRFRKPLSPDPEPDKVFSAVQKPDACYQVIDTMFQASPGAQMWQPNTPLSEDCLYLNIWVPILPEEQRCEKDKKLPVMVWIFGGSFSTGSSVLNVYDGRFLSTRQNVIVVTLNYRLGPFGFLYLNYSGAPGNMGLWDQRLAIKWVKDHIEHFNGDPDRITLFGESAGSVSVSAHVISPWSHSFFRNAILQSGSVFGYWGVETAQKQLNQSLRLLDLIGCGGRSGEDLHACLQLKPSSAFIDAQNSLYDPYAYLSIPFPPVLDGHFLPYNSSQSFRELEFLKPSGSLMMGMNTNEGSYFLLYAFVGNETLMKDRNALPVRTHTEYLKALYRVLDMHGVDRPDLLEPLIALTDFEYQDYTHLPGPTTWTNKLEKISSDRSFKCPTIDFARVIVNEQRAVHKHPNKRSVTRPTYFYEFTHRTKSLPWPTWAGVMHGYEIEYVFGIPFSPLFNEAFYGFTDEERELSDVMMTYWANFARTGDPNILATGDHVAGASGSELAVPDKVTAPSGRSWVLNGFERPKDAPLLAVGGSQSCLPHRLPLRNWQEFDNRTEAFLILAAGRDGLRTGIHPRSRQCLFWRHWFPTLMQQAERLAKICPSFAGSRLQTTV